MPEHSPAPIHPPLFSVPRPMAVVGVIVMGLLVGCEIPETTSQDRPIAAAEGAQGFKAGASPASSATNITELATLAERLAGLDGGNAANGQDPLWSSHAVRMETLWSEIEQRHLSAIRDWSTSTLTPAITEPNLPLFYPFGGPDFLSSFLFFPEAPVHVLVGLQPPGRLPSLSGVNGLGGENTAILEAELTRLRSGFESLMEAGYFQQTDMDADFAAERLDGVLPVLYIFLARTGHRPIAVHHRNLDEDGRLVDPTPGEEAKVVEIAFVRRDDLNNHGVSTRSLVYFAQDLSDQGLAASPEFAKYLERFGSWNVFMKAAVYLLHMDGFTSFRDLLLAGTRTLLQTDSGLPLRDLDPSSWDLRYFGVYTQTLPVYRDWFQNDLKTAFETASAPPLDFAIGYHGVIGEGCLILAERRRAP